MDSRGGLVGFGWGGAKRNALKISRIGEGYIVTGIGEGGGRGDGWGIQIPEGQGRWKTMRGPWAARGYKVAAV